ncbi:inosine/xanthosine triphosphatase [Thermogladius sp. 4427co]|uniref:inosine/xanthosine triphosphatase n=1 Tax=Thermogladius sp. 4427co TaxID=3450718 RepID=UPI003F7A8AB3
MLVERLGEEIRLCIGSRNPSKIAGVRQAFEYYFKVVEVDAMRVESGIPAQPIGLDTIIRGARTRAEKAFRDGCDFSVGVEAGFYSIGGEYYDVEAAYVIYKNGVSSIGFSPAFPIPWWFVEDIEKGRFRELEEIVERVYSVKNIGDSTGFISILTKNAVVRSELSKLATLMALTKILNYELYARRLI